MKKTLFILLAFFTLTVSAQKEKRSVEVRDVKNYYDNISKLQVYLSDELILKKDTVIKKYTIKNGVAIETTKNKNRAIIFKAGLKGTVTMVDTTTGVMEVKFSVKHRDYTLRFKSNGLKDGNVFQIEFDAEKKFNTATKSYVVENKYILIGEDKYKPSTDKILLDMYGKSNIENDVKVSRAEGAPVK